MRREYEYRKYEFELIKHLTIRNQDKQTYEKDVVINVSFKEYDNDSFERNLKSIGIMMVLTENPFKFSIKRMQFCPEQKYLDIDHLMRVFCFKKEEDAQYAIHNLAYEIDKNTLINELGNCKSSASWDSFKNQFKMWFEHKLLPFIKNEIQLMNKLNNG